MYFVVLYNNFVITSVVADLISIATAAVVTMVITVCHTKEQNLYEIVPKTQPSRNVLKISIEFLV